MLKTTTLITLIATATAAAAAPATVHVQGETNAMQAAPDGQGDAGWMRENMPQNRLAILPDLTHYETFMAPALVTTVLPFLNGESGIPSRAEQVNR